MMPEMRKTNSACLTAPAKIQPKKRMDGSAMSWIQRGMSRRAALTAGICGLGAGPGSC
jgi:hypothetical protein